jgi:tripartite-type tricarboxylate transporter receptor subunit TctC
MKKLLLSLVLLLVYSCAFAAPVKVQVVWGWTYAQAQAQVFKAILDQANNEQNKYEFILEPRPGSGGVVATRTVLANTKEGRFSLLANGPPFFPRPYLYPDSGYRLDQFKQVLILGHQQVGLVTKGKTVDDLRKQKRIIIGSNGVGTTGHLMAEKLSKTVFAGKQVDIVQYGTLPESILAVQGGFIDMSSAYMSDIEGKEGLTMSAMTGRRPVPGSVLLKDIGAPEFADFNSPFFILATADADPIKIKEIQTILLKAQKSPIVKEASDFQGFVQLDMYKNPAQYNAWYQGMVKQFADFTKGIDIK